MKDSGYSILFITAGSGEESQKIAHLLVNQKKAACVNIIPSVKSLFLWKGELDSAEEELLIVKTKTAKIPEVIKSVKEAHSYDVPEIIALPIVDGNKDYLAWIDEEVA